MDCGDARWKELEGRVQWWAVVLSALNCWLLII
jgi:hypothetical protein